MHAEAEPLLIDGYEGLMASRAKVTAKRREDVAAASARIPVFYEAWGKAEAAATWRSKLAGTFDPAEPK